MKLVYHKFYTFQSPSGIYYENICEILAENNIPKKGVIERVAIGLAESCQEIDWHFSGTSTKV